MNNRQIDNLLERCAALEAERDELKRHIAHSEYGRHRWREKALVARAECDKYKRRLAKIQGIAEGRKP